MLDAAHLRARAAEYRASAEKASDSKMRELCLSVARYLDAWADEVEAMEATHAASRPPPLDRQAG
jgi:hypothetical protein